MFYKVLNKFNINPKFILDRIHKPTKYHLETYASIYKHKVRIPVSKVWRGDLFFNPVPNDVYELLEELNITRCHPYYDWHKFVSLRLTEIEGEVPVIWDRDLDLYMLFRNADDAVMFRLTYMG